MAHSHVQSSWDWGCRECKHIDFSTKGFQLFLLLHAKAMLFINNNKAKIFELNIALQQFVSTNYYVGPAILNGLHCFIDLAGATKTAEQFNSNGGAREAVAERIVMLLGQKCCGYQYRHLLAGMSGHKSGPHGHFGFVEANIATNQSVHWPFAGHIFYN